MGYEVLRGAVPTPSVVLDALSTGFASLTAETEPCISLLSHIHSLLGPHLVPFDSPGHFGGLQLFPVLGLILLSPVPIRTSLALTEMRLSPQSSSELPCFFNTVEVTGLTPLHHCFTYSPSHIPYGIQLYGCIWHNHIISS